MARHAAFGANSGVVGVKGLVIAVQFLTRLPTPRLQVTAQDFAGSIRWFPAVGLIVGLAVAGAGWAANRIDPWAGALAALTSWVMVTGALHLDGLGDIADAAGAAHQDRGRLTAVLADPHIGSFGVVIIAMQLMAKLVLLHAVMARGLLAALVLVPFAARIGPLAWTRWLPPLHDGLGARFRGAVRLRDLAGWGAALLLAAWWSPSLLTVAVLVPAWGSWLLARIGGISGDGHGAGIELIETALLLVLLVGASL